MNFVVNVDFITPIADTLSSVDTIPILQIDSVCFSASCIGSTYCRILYNNDSIDYDLIDRKKYVGGWVDTAVHIQVPHRDNDLKASDGEYHPRGFFAPYGIDLPLECVDSFIIATLYSRLIDRVTGGELKRAISHHELTMTTGNAPAFIPYPY